MIGGYVKLENHVLEMVQWLAQETKKHYAGSEGYFAEKMILRKKWTPEKGYGNV